ncbi:hypothetical protein ACFPFP_17535 [Bradyrhizobium sp. GCM10023182]|uniref:DNA-binding protein n=1 Tax=Bradyrhizobium zhengyangense TaxID=2911009 RepID=A0ABS9LPD6_9BRAD|nr:hypothetical protein [Bradyrhizobium zhengyangense]MCG2668756.1 hypothetical protein [Bradyrhizobium zhengyangense]
MTKIQQSLPTWRYIRAHVAFKTMGIGRTRGYRLIKQGLLVAKKLGRSTFIDMQSAERLFEELPELNPATRTLSAGDLGLE